jgi:nuclear transport factor 2 (NTF2) superfamily protein
MSNIKYFLIEYRSDDYIYERHLFTNRDKAKNFLRKKWDLKYNRTTGRWDNPDNFYKFGDIRELSLEG